MLSSLVARLERLEEGAARTATLTRRKGCQGRVGRRGLPFPLDYLAITARRSLVMILLGQQISSRGLRCRPGSDTLQKSPRARAAERERALGDASRPRGTRETQTQQSPLLPHPLP